VATCFGFIRSSSGQNSEIWATINHNSMYSIIIKIYYIIFVVVFQCNDSRYQNQGYTLILLLNRSAILLLTFIWPCIFKNLFVIKPTRCTKFTNLFCHETLHISGSSSVHHQELIHCTLSDGVCHTSLEAAYEQDLVLNLWVWEICRNWRVMLTKQMFYLILSIYIIFCPMCNN
jgi:hypothetical protein